MMSNLYQRRKPTLIWLTIDKQKDTNACSQKGSMFSADNLSTEVVGSNLTDQGGSCVVT